MTYVKTNWENGKTPINATNLNKIEEGIANAVETDSEARLKNVVSRNLANANNYLLGHINMSNGGIDEDNNWAYTKVKVKPNTQYTYQLTSTEDQEYEVAQYQSNGTYIVGDYGNWASGKQSYTFTTSNNVDYILIAWRNDLNHSNIQVEEGPNATNYVPYLNLEEAMKENQIYSTDERVIGKWTNGKPIYRKVIVLDNNLTLQANSWNSSHLATIPNVELVVNSLGLIPGGVTSQIRVGISGNGELSIMNPYSSFSIEIRNIVLEYTKTTD